MIYYDIIIIGGGISGLYFVYKYLKNTNLKYIILEKNNYIGGRIKYDMFHNKEIQLGAGVILPKHKHLLTLLKELNIEILKVNSEPNKFNDSIIPKIKETYNKNINEINKLNLSFIQFLNMYFDSSFVDSVIEYSDYNDYFDTNVHKTINEYPLEDILVKKKSMYILKNGWKELLNKLTTNNIILNEYVSEIYKNNYYEITTNNNKYKCRKLVITADLSMANIKWNIPINVNNLYNNIGSIPFYRIYSYHKENVNINQMIKTNNLIDKIIPITPNILMSVYTDNNKAIVLKNLLDNNKDNKIFVLNKLLQQVIHNIPLLMYLIFFNILFIISIFCKYIFLQIF